MGELPFRYTVIALERDGRFGAVIQKCHRKSGRTEKRYFFLENEGLLPTREMEGQPGLELCPLKAIAPHRNFLSEVVDHAQWAFSRAHSAAKARPVTKSTANRFADACQRIFETNRYTTLNSPIRAFFGSRVELKTYVIQKPRGRDAIAGDALFQYGRPEQFFPVEDFRYLKPTKIVLRTNGPTEPRLARPGGPLACDFRAGLVHRPAKPLKSLSSLLHNHPIVLLEGQPATGKSVITRWIAYERFVNYEPATYFVDCAAEPDLNPGILAQEIDTVPGLFVIENVHVWARQCQVFLEKLQRRLRQRLVLTARPSVRHLMCLARPRIDDASTERLRPFDYANDIIHLFLASTEVSFPVDHMAIARLRERSRGDYWMLSLGLQRLFDRKRREDSEECIRDSVLDRLRDLEMSDIPASARFPEALLALVPLACAEALTSASFLEARFNLDRGLYNTLFLRGEVERREVTGEVLFGLPHSSLAEAYWEHGSSWRGAWSIADIVYDYSCIGAPNGLRVILQSNDAVRDEVLERLINRSKILDVVRAEVDMNTVAEYLVLLGDRDPPIVESALRILAGKIISSKDVRGTVATFDELSRSKSDLSNRLLGLIDVAGLIQMLLECENITDVCRWLSSIQRASPAFLEQVLALFPPAEIGRRIRATNDLSVTASCLRALHDGGEMLARKVWTSFDPASLATQLAESTDGESVRSFVAHMHECRCPFWSDIRQHVNRAELAVKASAQWAVVETASFFGLAHSDRSFALEVWDAMDVRLFADRMQHTQQLSDTMAALRSILTFADEAWNQLWPLISPAALVARVIHSGEIVSLSSFLLQLLERGKTQCAQQLCDSMDVNAVAESLATDVRVEDVAVCVHTIWSTDAGKAAQVCNAFSMEELCGSIRAITSPLDVCFLVATAWAACPERGATLWHAVNKAALALRLSAYDPFRTVSRCIEMFTQACPCAAHELCAQINTRLMADRLRDEGPEIGWQVLAMMSKASEQVAAELSVCLPCDLMAGWLKASWRLRDITRFLQVLAHVSITEATRVCVTLSSEVFLRRLAGRQLQGLGGFMATIAELSEETTQRLWDVLDVKEAASYLGSHKTNVYEIAGMLYSADTTRAHQILRLLKGTHALDAITAACIFDEERACILRIVDRRPELRSDLWSLVRIHDLAQYCAEGRWRRFVTLAKELAVRNWCWTVDLVAVVTSDELELRTYPPARPGDLADLLEVLWKHSSELAKRLCAQLDGEAVAVATETDQQGIARLVDVLRKINPRLARKIKRTM